MATGRRIKMWWAALTAIVAVLAAAGIVIALRSTGSDQHRAAGVVTAPVSSSAAANVTSRSATAKPTPKPSTSRPRATASSTSRPSTPVASRAAGSTAPAPPAVPTPARTSSAPVGTYPQWLPFHTTMKLGCVKSNCENNYHGYWAIDFETLDNKPGAPVYAAGAGRVRIASQGSGNCGGPGTVENALAVDHGNGVESVYVHLHDFAVAPGAWVTPNTVIGHVGSSGYTDPCPDYHLHYELRINGVSVNPGALKACHGSALITYPYAIGYADWNAIPPQEYAGGKLNPKGRTLYSTGAACG